MRTRFESTPNKRIVGNSLVFSLANILHFVLWYRIWTIVAHGDCNSFKSSQSRLRINSVITEVLQKSIDSTVF